jgi:hypothetical protein
VGGGWRGGKLPCQGCRRRSGIARSNRLLCMCLFTSLVSGCRVEEAYNGAVVLPYRLPACPLGAPRRSISASGRRCRSRALEPGRRAARRLLSSKATTCCAAPGVSVRVSVNYWELERCIVDSATRPSSPLGKRGVRERDVPRNSLGRFRSLPPCLLPQPTMIMDNGSRPPPAELAHALEVPRSNRMECPTSHVTEPGQTIHMALHSKRTFGDSGKPR